MFGESLVGIEGSLKQCEKWGSHEICSNPSDIDREAFWYLYVSFMTKL
jgi:hypothetical protein